MIAAKAARDASRETLEADTNAYKLCRDETAWPGEGN